jgi:ketosteroid isomerase-like protein
MKYAISLAAVVMVAPAPGAQQSSPDLRALRESLRSSDQASSGFSAMKGFVRWLTLSNSDDLVLLLDGAPITRGREAAATLIGRLERLGHLSVSWQPLRVLVSEDGTLGVTFGVAAIAGPNFDQNAFGPYIRAWRRGTGDTWRLVAYVQNGLPLSGLDLASVAGITAGPPPGPRDEFALADLDFADAARRSNAPDAFARFSAPDAITFARGGDLNIGPSAIGARLAEGPAATAAWRWWPVLTIAAASGDVGVTVGESEIRLPGATVATLSKYVTVWQRQPDGSLKFVVDAGNARPGRK